MAEPRVELRWNGAESFSARSPEGSEVVLDGDARAGLSPMQSLLASVAACMGIDVVLILKKMRAAPDSLVVAIEGDRQEDPPRRYTAARMRFRIEGPVERSQAERAVALSLETYCSVLHTLRADLDVTTEIELVGPREA